MRVEFDPDSVREIARNWSHVDRSYLIAAALGITIQEVDMQLATWRNRRPLTQEQWDLKFEGWLRAEAGNRRYDALMRKVHAELEMHFA